MIGYTSRLTKKSVPIGWHRLPSRGYVLAPWAACWLVFSAPFARADQIVADGVNYADARIIGLEQGRLQFRDATGLVHATWLSNVGLMVVDRGGVFSDFNQAERFMASHEAERAVVRYRRTMALAEDFWPELITARLAVAYNRTAQLDQAVLSFIQVLRGKRTGPSLAARLLPDSIPAQREAAAVRAIESIDGALSRPTDDTSRALLQLLRYEILRRTGDKRATPLASEVASLTIPEPARSEQAYRIQWNAMRQMTEGESGSVADAELLADLDDAIRDGPDAVLPSFLLVKGNVLFRSASTREENIEAAWPFLRVAIHFPDDARAAEGLYGAALAVERLGRSDQAMELLKECMAHKHATDETRFSADAALKRLRADRKASP